MGCLSAKVTLASEQLRANISFICMPNTDIYLRVAYNEKDIPVSGEAAELFVSTNTSYKVYRTPIDVAHLNVLPTEVNIPVDGSAGVITVYSNSDYNINKYEGV